jgi:hypothetical protein
MVNKEESVMRKIKETELADLLYNQKAFSLKRIVAVL